MLLDQGADLTKKNKDEKTPFSIALSGNRINILDMLTDTVKISDDLMLLHHFKSHIFDERYLVILQKLLQREESNLKADDFNTLDHQGFNVFLAYIQSWTQH